MAPRSSDPALVETPLGAVTVRAVPPRLLDAALRRRGKKLTDLNARRQLRFYLGVADPSFTEAEVARIFDLHSERIITPILDRIDELSGSDEHLQARFAPATPAQTAWALRGAIEATAPLRRTPAPARSQGHERRRGCNERSRGSRRTATSTRAGPDSGEPPGDDEPPGRRHQLLDQLRGGA